MSFLDKEIEEYAENFTSDESPVLKQIRRDTEANVYMPRMLSGHLQGRILSTFSSMISPKLILEIGTYTGYSAICLAEGLSEDGKIITIDINAELEEKIRENFSKSGFGDKIDFRVGDALKIIPKIHETFDLAFIDADKENYANYYHMVMDRLAPGGYIIADNVLWSGKVLPNSKKKPDKDTTALIKFNREIHNDHRVENVLLPIRDGLMIIKKNK